MSIELEALLRELGKTKEDVMNAKAYPIYIGTFCDSFDNNSFRLDNDSCTNNLDVL